MDGKPPQGNATQIAGTEPPFDTEEIIAAQQSLGQAQELEEGRRANPGMYGGSVPLRKLFSFVSPCEILIYCVGIVGAILHGMGEPFMAVVSGDWIDAVSQAGMGSFTDEINSLALELTIIGGCVALAGTVQGYCFGYFVDVAVARIRPLYFRALLYRDIAWLDTHDVGSLPTEIDAELECYKEGLGTKCGVMIMSTSKVIVCYTFGILTAWQVALGMAGVVPILALGIVLMEKSVMDTQQERQGAYARSASLVEEVLYAVRTVVSSGGEHREIARYKAGVEEASRGGVIARTKMGLGMGFLWHIYFLSYGLSFYVGMQTIYNGGDISIGKMISALFCTIFAGFTAGQIPPGFAALNQARVSMARFFHINEHQGEIQKHLVDNGEVCAPIETLELRDVHFSYPSGASVKVLWGLNLLIKKGQKVAVVGESGSGKSTVMALLERFYDPQDGMVLVNGVDLRQLSVASYRRHVGYVGQEPVLFATSVKANIMHGSPNATAEDVQRAAKFANLDFIDNLPERFNTYVGSGGSQFSGGQKQRIAIARALLKQPSVLFLDEATSALDHTSEKMIQATIDSIGSNSNLGMTIVSIAHRLSTVKNADVIYVMRDGRVVEEGSHEELIAMHGGIYQALAAAQAFSAKEESADAAPGEEPPDEVHLAREASGFSKAGTPVTSTSDVEQYDENQCEALRAKHIAKQYKVPMVRLLGFCRPEWWAFIPGFLGALMSGACFPLLGAFVLVDAMVAFVNYGTTGDREALRDEIEFRCILFVLVAVARLLGTVAQFVGFALLGEGMTKRCRVAMLTSIFRQEIGFHDHPENTPARLVQSLQVYAHRISALCITFGDKADALCAVAVGLIIAFIAQWQMTLVMLVAIPVFAIEHAIEISVNIGGSAKENKVLKEASQVVSDSLCGARTVHAGGNENEIVELYSSLVRNGEKDAGKASFASGFAYGFSHALTFWVGAGGFWFMGYLIDEGKGTFTDCMRAFMGIIFTGFGAGMAFALTGDVGKGKVAARDIFQLLDRPSAINGLEPTGRALDGDDEIGRMEFSNVEFFYPFRPDVHVLRNLSFTIEAGQSVGLVGPSGGGKSTVLSMIQRFYNPQVGQVCIGRTRTPLPQVNVRWWRKQVGFVGQEPILFNTSVLENVKYGSESGEVVSEEQLEKVKRMANLNFLNHGKAQGWETQVGPRGFRLSGGQKQRVAIARALLWNPPILLLDEATSALDSANAQVISQALKEASKGRTTFAIAHRLSTIQTCDVILVLAQGELAESGTHTELMQLDGVYAKLYAQRGANETRK